MIATVVTCILVGFVYFLFFYKDRWVKEQIDKIPGPKTLPLIGNVHQLRFGHGKLTYRLSIIVGQIITCDVHFMIH